MTIRIIITILVAPLLGIHTCVQGEVYRYVDEQGQVTYSDQAPAGDTDVETISLPEQPRQSDVDQTRQRTKAIQQQVKQLESERKAKENQRRQEQANAKKEVDAARTALESAKVIKEGDWVHRKNGARTLSAEYFERIQQAEENLEEAKRKSN